MDQHKATIKSISKLITLSSQHFFSAFLEDSQDQKNKERNAVRFTRAPSQRRPKILSGLTIERSPYSA